MNKVIKKVTFGLKGSVEIPADKSMSHRAVIFSSLAKGKSIIKNFSFGKDPLSSLNVCKNLGVDITLSSQDKIVYVNSNGIKYFDGVLDCGNSGTTIRLMSGVLAGCGFTSVLSGDKSLISRPMKRVIEPLTLMGAKIDSNDFKAPLTIYGGDLSGIIYNSKLASAQVKSCVLLAGLSASGKTVYTEPFLSRNHTEILLKHMGANIETVGNTVTIQKSELHPMEIEVFGDISSCAYFLTAGLIVPNSDITLKNVGLNPTRTGIIDVIKKMGGNIEILNERKVCGEIVGDIRVQYTENLQGCKISGELIPRLIDEIPIICVLASQCSGETVISDAQDLRNKESDRISSTACELKKLGVDITETFDGLVINGKTAIQGGVEVNSYHDHRLAMSLYVAGIVAKNEICIKDFEWVDISFPEFETLFEQLVS